MKKTRYPTLYEIALLYGLSLLLIVKVVYDGDGLGDWDSVFSAPVEYYTALGLSALLAHTAGLAVTKRK